MARSVKRGGRKRRAKYNSFRTNKVKAYRKRQKKAKKLACGLMQEAWDKSKTVKENMEEMGLVYDLNKALKFPSPKDELEGQHVEGMEISSLGEDSKAMKKKKSKKAKKVLDVLEKEASKQRPTQKRLPNNEVLFCVRMMDRYGDDYEAMARDSNNHYQQTPNQIRHKIKHFKQSHQYRAYLTAKNMGMKMPSE